MPVRVVNILILSSFDHRKTDEGLMDSLRVIIRLSHSSWGQRPHTPGKSHEDGLYLMHSVRDVVILLSFSFRSLHFVNWNLKHLSVSNSSSRQRILYGNGEVTVTLPKAPSVA